VSTADAFGLTYQQVSNFYTYVLDKLWRKKYLLQLDKHPNRQEIFDSQIPSFWKAVQRKAEVTMRFCGFVDGTRVNVERPTDNLLQECVYNGWKHAHNILWQGFVTPNGMLMDLSHAFTGRHNDRFVFKVCHPLSPLFFIN
jgi:hypothetical protein